jgi:hypothetical protein
MTAAGWSRWLGEETSIGKRDVRNSGAYRFRFGVVNHRLRDIHRMHACTAAGGSHGKRPGSRTEIDQNIAGGQPEQVEDLIAFLDVAKVSMGGIVNLDLRRIAVVFSYLLKLVILPGNHASRIALHILARWRWVGEYEHASELIRRNDQLRR